MNENPESDNYNPCWDLESDDYRIPNQVMRNFTAIYFEPQPVFLLCYFLCQKTRLFRRKLKQIFRHWKLLQSCPSQKPNCTPLVKKEIEDEDARKMRSSSCNDASAQTPKSVQSQLQKTKAVQRVRARFSKPQITIRNPLARRVAQFVDGASFSIVMAIVTIYALFGDDIRILAVNQVDGDDVFFVLTTICMVCYTLEILITCIANPTYLFNFYFWLDVISTATMILDIGWITNSWYGDKGDVQNAATLKALGKASRTARKAARVIRVIRLVRLIKLYKHARQQIEKEKQKKILIELLKDKPTIPQQRANMVRISLLQQARPKKSKQEDNQLMPYLKRSQNSQFSPKPEAQSSPASSNLPKPENSIKESHVGSLLSDLVMRRVITIIIAILISIPILTLDTYQEVINSYDSGLFRIAQYRHNQVITSMLVEQYVKFHNDEIYPIQSVYVLPSVNSKYQEYNYTSYPEWFDYTSLTKDQYRFSDQQYYVTTDANNSLITYSVADLVAYNQINALLSIFQTVFVCIVLALSAVLFNKDVSELVIEPIESMIQKIELIATNPLEAVNIEEQEDLILEELEKNHDIKKLKQKKVEQLMETQQLQKILVKIGSLLAVGFGEAGSNIIAENIKKSGSVDPMVPGKKILAIFGFCDIRNFTDATEVLQEDVMVFVNEIAEIVHSTVDQYGGSPNKNIGDAFLLVWKYPAIKFHHDPEDNKQLILSEEHSAKQLGDMAVLAFLKVIISVSNSKKLDKYKKHQRLNERIKDYSVKMGFGLHMGWGIEGAIGSSFKIDASYLSPNVNMASRLEAATKQFGTSILISGILKRHLTQACQSYLRLIDVVTVKGSIEPVQLYTVDLSLKNVQSRFPEPRDLFDTSKMNPKQQKQLRVVNRYKRNLLLNSVEENKIEIADFLEKDDEILAAREPFTQEFNEFWITGFNHYIRGEWQEAQEIFTKTLTMIPDHKDGPSNTLLEVIKQSGGNAPHDWKGYRELTEK